MDSLNVGDAVKTADGRTVRIQRVKTMEVSPSKNTNPYIIQKGQFGARQKVLISPRHCVFVEGAGMVEARKLGLKQFNMPSEFTYYNLELPNWTTDNMVVAGVTVESLAPERAVNAVVAYKNLYKQIKQQALAFLKANYPEMSEEDIAKVLQTCKVSKEGKLMATLPAKRA
jgi:hypothetical protein